MKNQKIIYTIGYEGRKIEQFISILKSANVEILLDVRYKANSRKKGFSKNKLRSVLEEAKISYQHNKNLGTPPELMDKRQKTGSYELDEYEKYINSHLELVKEAADQLKVKRVALLCFELNPNQCHRLVVADKLAKFTNTQVVHL